MESDIITLRHLLHPLYKLIYFFSQLILVDWACITVLGKAADMPLTIDHTT